MENAAELVVHAETQNEVQLIVHTGAQKAAGLDLHTHTKDEVDFGVDLGAQIAAGLGETGGGGVTVSSTFSSLVTTVSSGVDPHPNSYPFRYPYPYAYSDGVAAAAAAATAWRGVGGSGEHEGVHNTHEADVLADAALEAVLEEFTVDDGDEDDDEDGDGGAEEQLKTAGKLVAVEREVRSCLAFRFPCFYLRPGVLDENKERHAPPFFLSPRQGAYSFVACLVF